MKLLIRGFAVITGIALGYIIMRQALKKKEIYGGVKEILVPQGASGAYEMDYDEEVEYYGGALVMTSIATFGQCEFCDRVRKVKYQPQVISVNSLSDVKNYIVPFHYMHENLRISCEKGTNTHPTQLFFMG